MKLHLQTKLNNLHEYHQAQITVDDLIDSDEEEDLEKVDLLFELIHAYEAEHPVQPEPDYDNYDDYNY